MSQKRSKLQVKSDFEQFVESSRDEAHKKCKKLESCIVVSIFKLIAVFMQFQVGSMITCEVTIVK